MVSGVRPRNGVLDRDQIPCEQGAVLEVSMPIGYYGVLDSI